MKKKIHKGLIDCLFFFFKISRSILFGVGASLKKIPDMHSEMAEDSTFPHLQICSMNKRQSTNNKPNVMFFFSLILLTVKSCGGSFNCQKKFEDTLGLVL